MTRRAPSPADGRKFPLRRRAGSAAWSRLALFLGACAGLVMTYFSAKMVVAGTGFYQAGLFLDRWEQELEIHSEEAWEIALEAARRASDTYPVTSGEYVDRLGRIYEWRSLVATDEESLVSAAEQALSAYRRSLAARPVSPYTWVRVASVKSLLGEIDQEFKDALKNAVEYGRWRPPVYLAVARLGLAEWEKLDQNLQTSVLDSVAAGLGRRSPEADNLALLVMSRQLQRPVCGRLQEELLTAEDNEVLGELCLGIEGCLPVGTDCISVNIRKAGLKPG